MNGTVEHDIQAMREALSVLEQSTIVSPLVIQFRRLGYQIVDELRQSSVNVSYCRRYEAVFDEITKVIAPDRNPDCTGIPLDVEDIVLKMKELMKGKA